jgi:NAD(P)-dependent dehydrogenase (short-subunit alcohol dehydrogenase family)
MRIEGAAALVTGGASGLGEATVRALAEAGAQVTIVDRDRERGEKLVAELGEEVAGFAEADVADPDQVQAAVAQAGARRPLRIAVNCAGVAWAARTLDRDGNPHDLDRFAGVVRVNLVGTFNVLRLAAAAMATAEPLEDDERGVIVNTASVAAFEGQIGQIAYAASKAGVMGMTLPAARDLSALGIRVCTIAPGTFDTPMLQALPDATRRSLGEAVPFPRRLGRPEEYAALVLHICQNVVLNGETIRLDGAIRMPPR